MSNRLFKPPEAAQYLGVSKQTLNCWRMDGKGPRYFKEGRLVRYPESELEAFVEARVKGKFIKEESNEQSH